MNIIEHDSPQTKIKQLEEEIQILKRRIINQHEIKEALSITQKVANRVLLSGGMAHDINDILQSISNTIQPALSMKTETDSDHQVIVKIGSLVEEGSRLIEQFLSVSRKIGSTYSPVDLNSIIREINMFLQKTIPGTTNFELDLSEGLKRINADEGQMGQVLMYLGLNAGDAMPAGGTLTIRTKNISFNGDDDKISSIIPPGDYVQLTVSDTGRGMPPQIIEHIFDPNFVSKTKNEETGIRMSVVYAIVKSHGGYIDCESRVGEGTTFKAHFPVSKDENQTISESFQEASSKTGYGQQTLMLVDDEQDILETGKRFLQRHGYRVITAENGREAINKYKKHMIDMVVLDLGLPDMNGLSCFKTLKSINHNAKIIISTGSYTISDEKEVLDLGAVAVLPKPYSLNELISTAKRILDGQSL